MLNLEIVNISTFFKMLNLEIPPRPTLNLEMLNLERLNLEMLNLEMMNLEMSLRKC